MGISNLRLFKNINENEKKIEYEEGIQERIGIWLGMYLDKLRYGSNKERKKLFDEINNRFLELLYKYGIDKEETITLANLRNTYKSIEFDCYLKKSKKNIKIELFQENGKDEPAKIKFKKRKDTKTYSIKERNNPHLDYYEEYNQKSGNKVLRQIDSDYKLDVTDGETTLHIELSPYNKTGKDITMREDLGEYDKQLDNMIGELSFPIDIKKVYEILLAYLGDSISDYKKISIFTMRDISSIDISKKEELIPSSLSILDGKLESVTTKIKDEDGIEKTISFDSKGNWSVNSENIKIRFRSDEEDGKIYYELRNCIQKNLLNAKPYSEVLEAEKLVGRVKKDLEEFISKRTNNKVKVKAPKEVITDATS